MGHAVFANLNGIVGVSFYALRSSGVYMLCATIGGGGVEKEYFAIFDGSGEGRFFVCVWRV